VIDVVIIPMSFKELSEGRRVGIPESIIGKMALGIEPSDREKEIINKLGKVYVEAHKKDGKWVKPQLRDLHGGSQSNGLTNEKYPMTRRVGTWNVTLTADAWIEDEYFGNNYISEFSKDYWIGYDPKEDKFEIYEPPVLYRKDFIDEQKERGFYIIETLETHKDEPKQIPKGCVEIVYQ